MIAPLSSTTHITIPQQSYLDLFTATAMGDSLGLPYENMPGKRVRTITKGNIRQRFVLGRRGMISDDTEHALITARALMDSGNDVKLFERKLSDRLKSNWAWRRLAAQRV